MSLLKFFKKEKPNEKVEKSVKKAAVEKEKKAIEKKPEPVLDTAKKTEIKKKKNLGAYKNVIRPLVTEKSATMASVDKYVFVVKNYMNKIEVRKAIKDMYGVLPVRVNMVFVSGKNVRHGRSSGKTKDWKKAIVSLKKGDKIEVYEGV
ncbi:MAG: 50S ribosomal protein L23 [Parcubacteria group bacterium GW2011_GWA2_38_13]|nr:MAG: 50S ribosomal protein L23 [Parcubacteria group bacterium GW2011_GWA2_38_13]